MECAITVNHHASDWLCASEWLYCASEHEMSE